MKVMRALLLLFGLCISSAWAGLAPDSIGGQLFHQGVAINRVITDATILFGADGRYNVLREEVGNVLQPEVLFVRSVPKDGTYVYLKTGDASATITLNEPSGTLVLYPQILGGGLSANGEELVVTLSFLAATTGSGAFGGFAGHGSFSLSSASAIDSPPIANVSLRGSVAPGKTLIAGLVVSAPRVMLIRVIGPGLAQFSVGGVWANPGFLVYNADRPITGGIPGYGGWTVDPTLVPAWQKIFASAGAFPLAADSKDAVALVSLRPGPYTIVCTAAAGDAGGEALIEAYALPW
jgi:hypothetical protein